MRILANGKEHVIADIWSFCGYLSKNNGYVAVNLPETIWLSTDSVCLCVFWVRSQCFSIHDPIAIALDILSLLHSSYSYSHEHKMHTQAETHTNTHQPTALVNDLNCIKCPDSSFSQVMPQAGGQAVMSLCFLPDNFKLKRQPHSWESNELTHVHTG